MVTTTPKVRKFLRQWRKRYPYPFAWVDDAANKRLRRSEAEWLAQFAGATSLKRREILSLIDWTFSSQVDRKQQAFAGIDGHIALGHAKRCITRALKETSATRALDHLLGERGGAPGWGPTIASAVLAACSPDTYLVADERALWTLSALGLFTPASSDSFVPADWWPYLGVCRGLASNSQMPLRAVGQALRVAAEHAPALPEKAKKRASRR